MSTSLIGRKLGKYQITEIVGHGGMATVYKGYQEEVDRYVAVKVLPPHPGQNERFIDRFRQEARTIAKLQHPHILPLYDYGNDNDILYLIMPLIEGGSLREKITEGKLSLTEIERILSQVASALDFAHKQGIIHRDIKPDNVLLNNEGFALLSDFGIAKLLEGNALTTTGGLIGTPAYIAPEQAQNINVDNRADIYSLGIVVYEMLTGEQPYHSQTPVQVIFQHITEPSPRVHGKRDDLPAQIDEVLDRALAKNPLERYSTAQEFADDFSKAIKGQAISQHAPIKRSDVETAVDLRTIPQVNAAQTLSFSPTNAENNDTPANTTIAPTGGNNRLILIGGFGLIAALLFVVLGVLLSQQSASAPTPTQVIIAEVTNTPSPTAIPPTETRDPNAIVPTAPPTLTAIAAGNLSGGSIRFNTTSAVGDTVQLQVENLPAAGTGQQYAAWLVNTRDNTERLIPNFSVNAFGSGLVSYTADFSLLTSYNRIIITRETEIGEAASEDIVYSAEVPIEMTDALFDILIASYAGLPSSPNAEVGSLGENLVESALIEARMALSHAQLAANSTSLGGLHTHSEHTANILMGTSIDYNGNGRGENPGLGVGVLHFIDLIESRIERVSSLVPPRVQGQLEIIRVCAENARLWVNQTAETAIELASTEDLEASAEQRNFMVEHATMAMRGIDLNSSGVVDPFEGECGLEQILIFGVSVADLELSGE